jgi:hypothetical protein
MDAPEVCCVNHPPRGLAASLASSENVWLNTKPAPATETVIDRLERAEALLQRSAAAFASASLAALNATPAGE